MQRIHLGRVGAAIGTACLLFGMSNGEAVARIVADAREPDATLQPMPGQVPIDVEASGLSAVLELDTKMTLPNVRAARFQPMQCSFDEVQHARACRSRHTNGDVQSAVSFRMRDAAGQVQRAFDAQTTDTVVVQTAYTTDVIDQGGHPVSYVGRGTQSFAGVSSASPARVLNGADTTFSSKRFGDSGVARQVKEIVYSGVTLPNTRDARFPTAGVVYTTWKDTFERPSDAKLSYRNLIVWFDGTRNPEAYIDGKRYSIDLVTSLATPLDAN